MKKTLIPTVIGLLALAVYSVCWNLSAATDATWNIDADGNWSFGGNWNPTTPNGAGDIARFGNAITAPHTVTVDQNITVGTVVFDNANKYTIATGGGNLIFNAPAGFASLVVNNFGTHDINVPVTLADTLDIRINSFAHLNLNAPIGESGGPQSLVKSGTGAFTLGGPGVNTYSGGTFINEGILALGADNVVPNHGTFGFAGGTLTGGRSDHVGALSLTANSILDLNGSGYLSFDGDIGSPVGILTIQNWSGALDNSGTFGRVYFRSDADAFRDGSSYLPNIKFDIGGTLYGAIELGSGEVVPSLTPFSASVPDGGSTLMLLAGALGTLGWFKRRSRR